MYTGRVTPIKYSPGQPPKLLDDHGLKLEWIGDDVAYATINHLYSSSMVNEYLQRTDVKVLLEMCGEDYVSCSLVRAPRCDINSFGFGEYPGSEFYYATVGCRFYPCAKTSTGFDMMGALDQIMTDS